MRYFAEISFLGTDFAGWQRQPNAVTVQQAFEQALSTALRTRTEVAGCGRTDAGVHASQFMLHFDTHNAVEEKLSYQLNSMLPDSIAVKKIWKVEDQKHARFSAISRKYKYYIIFNKDPFRKFTAWHYPYHVQTDFEKVQGVADLLLQYNAFRPFCKSGSDTPHYLCDLIDARWEVNESGAIFTIKANRFLRGMVRLIVGTCLAVGRGKIAVAEVQNVLETQTALPIAESAPACGLHLVGVEYQVD